MATKRLDVTGVLTENDFQDLLSAKLGFPDYYGRNLDAFDECIEEYCANDTVIIAGLHGLPSGPREYMSKYVSIMREIENNSDGLFKLVIE